MRWSELHKDADWVTLRQQAQARRDWAVRLHHLPVAEAIAELDALETAHLFDIESSRHLFDHKIRRFAADILQWRAMDTERNGTCQNLFKPFGEQWADSCGVPDHAAPRPKFNLEGYQFRGHRGEVETDWYARAVMDGVDDLRPRQLFESRMHRSMAMRSVTAFGQGSRIDRLLHAADNTVRFP